MQEFTQLRKVKEHGQLFVASVLYQRGIGHADQETTGPDGGDPRNG
jgi:hypothetical protein